jgi:hypothetical protein
MYRQELVKDTSSTLREPAAKRYSLIGYYSKTIAIDTEGESLSSSLLFKKRKRKCWHRINCSSRQF